MSPICHACGQPLGQIKAPPIDLVPPVEVTEKKKENKLNDPAKVINTIGSGLPTMFGTLLDFAQDWIPGYHIAKRVLSYFHRKTSPTTALAISPVHTVASSGPIDSIEQKRKRPKHKKKPRNTPINPVQGKPPKSKLPVPTSTSEQTCRRCHQVFRSRKELFMHLNACQSSSGPTSAV
ncbi:hypothetical protein QR685DRAFT_568965 [Neurospora intermedia]|uniref:C2H2-type domain-containing protein n=1 Tax=Neurospora intermedia TaxID=5142 RepID=A0ABR3DKI8_NEUIN